MTGAGTVSARAEQVVELVEAMRRFWAAASARRGRETRQPGGLSIAQVRLARELHDGGPLTGSQLARAARCSPGAVSEMLDQLDRAGIVRRERSESDRRVHTVSLTETGRRLVEEKLAWMREQAAAALVDCSDGELAAATKVLSRLTGMLDAPPS